MSATTINAGAVMVDEYLQGMSRRLRRVAELLQREISSIIPQLHDPRIHMCTLTRVLPSADLRSARVCVSVYGTEEQKSQTIIALQHASGYIQRLISERLFMKFTPTLFFVQDKSLEHSDRIARILKSIEEERKEVITGEEGGGDEV